MSDVLAAGGVLWRVGASGPEVAVVHRPRYDDWSLPKGKPDPGEPLTATAVREIAEETGHRAVLGPRLCSTRYPLVDGRQKTVHYWAAQAIDGAFTPGDEIDELRWLAPSAASELLSHRHDQALLADLEVPTAVCATVLLVRHAKAGKRDQWSGDDALRPLTATGRRQAEALRSLLPPFGPIRVHSAPPVRCAQTVRPLADDLGVPVLSEPLLGEDRYWDDPAAGRRRLAEIVGAAGAGTGSPTVVCSQGGVIPDVVTTLGESAGIALGDVRSRKGSVWVLSFRTGPVLAAADYHDDPLP